LCHAELLFLSFMSLAPRDLKRSFLERVLTFLGLGVGLEAQVLVNNTGVGLSLDNRQILPKSDWRWGKVDPLARLSPLLWHW